MTITPFEMYWITRASAIGMFFTIVALATAGLFVLSWYIYEEERKWGYDDDWERFFKKSRKVLILGLILSTIGAIFTPRTKDFAAIIVIPAIVNSEVAQENVPKAMNGIFKLAEAWMEELKPEKEGRQ